FIWSRKLRSNSRFRPSGIWSHLFTTMIIPRPPSCAYPAIVESAARTPSVASSTTRTTSAIRICRRAITTLSFSVISVVLPLRRILALLRIDLVHDECKRTSQTKQHLRQVAIRARDLGAAVDQKNDVIRLLERAPRLPQNLARDVVGILNDDPARVDHLEAAAL